MAVARASSGVFAMLTFASVGLVLIFLVAPGVPATSRVAEIAAIPLTDDDGDQALFPSTALAPGHPTSRCLGVQYNGPASPGDVHLLAEDVSGALAGRLEVTVERGTGGSFASCAGFSGSVVYDGLLADLAAGPADVGISTGWVPAAADSRTYRITVDVLSGTAPGQTSTATFRWVIVPGPAPAPSTPAPAPSTPERSTTEPVVPEPAESSAPPTADSPTRVPAGTSDAPSPGVGPVPARPKSTKRTPSGLARLGPLIDRMVEVTADLAARTARHSGVPFASTAAVVLFMLVQRWIDKRDPKLALAPVTGDPYLDFGPAEAGGAGGGT